MDAVWPTDCHTQEAARFHHRPHPGYRDQDELLALMYRFILNCGALLEIHVCQVAFVPDTKVCIPSKQSMDFRY
jgi:hypothetical protein